MELKSEITVKNIKEKRNSLIKHLNECYKNMNEFTDEFYTSVIAENLALMSVLKVGTYLM